MNVQELIDRLSELPRDLEVIVGSDDEGNDFNTPFIPQVVWCIEDDGYRCGYSPVSNDDVGTEYDPEELVKFVVM